ncbi:MAG TPA: UDP-3-O-acyl-N-acetylglucosamine deacetylase [Chlamydiales bacterium]|nr:UDP-3-O-acyl-N-acetylglucosamine deacetylase [Chlamydiales bacterium]
MTGFFSLQKTLQKSAEFAGIGLFTGMPSRIRLVPASEDAGIVFQRIDLPGRPEIPATLDFVSGTPRCTCLARENASVQMVEHLLSALYGFGIDALRIEVDGPEIPAGDGSAREYVRLIEEAGIRILEAPKKVILIEQPVYWSQGDIQIIGLPSPEFRISYTLHYPQSPLIRSQFYSFKDRYKEEIASCRTFSLYEEIAPFIEKGLIKGGGLDNALVIQGDRILNPEGTRFPDEMVRHKVLDLMGDLSLLGAALQGHILSVRSGHTANVAFAKLLHRASQGVCLQ